MGSEPLGAVTVPLMLVVPLGHVVCCVQSPVQAEGEPHTLGVPPPPHVPVAHAPPQLTTPPPPSATTPQFAPAGHAVAGWHALPHRLAVPPPPQVFPVPHVPQSIRLPQPSACIPQLAPSSVHVLATQMPASLTPPSAPPPVPQVLGPPPPQ